MSASCEASVISYRPLILSILFEVVVTKVLLFFWTSGMVYLLACVPPANMLHMHVKFGVREHDLIVTL